MKGDDHDACHAAALKIAARLKQLKPNDKPGVKIGIAMDDGFVSLELDWGTLAKATEEQLVPLVCAVMRNADEEARAALAAIDPELAQNPIDEAGFPIRPPGTTLQ